MCLLSSRSDPCIEDTWVRMYISRLCVETLINIYASCLCNGSYLLCTSVEIIESNSKMRLLVGSPPAIQSKPRRTWDRAYENHLHWERYTAHFLFKCAMIQLHVLYIEPRHIVGISLHREMTISNITSRAARGLIKGRMYWWGHRSARGANFWVWEALI